MLGSLFPPLLLPTCPRCLTSVALAGLQELTAPIRPSKAAAPSPSSLLTSCHPVSFPPDSLHFSTTQTLKEAAGGSLPDRCNLLPAFHLLRLHKVQDP